MIALFGCGALGSWLALFLATPDTRFVLVDDDRVSAENLGTSAFSRQHIGALKAQALGAILYRKCGAIAHIHTESLTERNLDRIISPVIQANGILLDCFDNVDSRRLACGLSLPTLHVGVSRERTGAAFWDEVYKLPEGPPRGEDQFCTHQAGRAILRFTAAVAAGLVEDFLATTNKRGVITTERLEIL